MYIKFNKAQTINIESIFQSCPEPRDEQEWQEQELNNVKYIRGPLRLVCHSMAQVRLQY